MGFKYTRLPPSRVRPLRGSKSHRMGHRDERGRIPHEEAIVVLAIVTVLRTEISLQQILL